VKSRFGASLEVLTHHQLLFYRRKERPIYLLSDAGIINWFWALRRDEERWHWGMVVAEFLLRGLPAAVPNRKLFNSALETLKGLSRANTEPDGLVYSFLFQGIANLGYQPYLDNCVKCKAKKITAFSIPLGGGLCPGCAQGEAGVVELGPSEIEVLRQLASGIYPIPKLAKPISIVMAQLIEKYLEYHMDGLKLNTLNRIQGAEGFEPSFCSITQASSPSG
jgi:DNA repair protein RecO